MEQLQSRQNIFGNSFLADFARKAGLGVLTDKGGVTGCTGHPRTPCAGVIFENSARMGIIVRRGC